MKITREAYGIKVLTNRLGAEPGQVDGAPPTPDCCNIDPTDIPDRANEDNGGDAWTYVEGTSPGFVQSATSGLVAGASTGRTVNLDTPATEDNLLVAVLFHRGGQGVTHTPDVGWDVLEEYDGFYGRITVAYKHAAGGETGVSWTYTSVNHEMCLMVGEYEGGVYAVDAAAAVDDTAGPDLTMPTVTPSAGLPGIVLAFIMQQPSQDPDFDPPWTQREESFDSVGNRSRYEWHDQVVPSFSGSYGGETGSGVSDGTTDASYVLVSFSLPGPVWLGDGSKAIDGDDATYEEVTGPNLLRIDLGAEHRIIRTRIRVALSGASARELTVRAAHDLDPDFDDPTTLTVIDFTSTGSFTAQDVEDQWATTERYRYFELTSDDTDTWRIHSWELYEGTLAIDLAAHTDDTDDAHDASAISYDPTASGMTATNVQDAIDELEASGGVDTDLVTVGATGASETVDVSVARTYDLTLTANCTITLTGAVDEEAWYLTLLLRQDGTGGRTVTWPGSVTWVEDEEPTLSTTPGDVDIITLLTVDGGSQWIGTAGQEAPDSVVAALDDLTDVNAPTPADGDVLVYDAGTSQWVPATPGSDADSIAALGFRGELLVSSTAANPITFDDLMLNSDGTDLLYAST